MPEDKSYPPGYICYAFYWIHNSDSYMKLVLCFVSSGFLSGYLDTKSRCFKTPISSFTSSRFCAMPKTIPLFSLSFVAVILKLNVTHSGSCWCSFCKQLLSSIYFRPDHQIYFFSWWFVFISFHVSGRCGRDRMVIRVITTYAINACHHWWSPVSSNPAQTRW